MYTKVCVDGVKRGERVICVEHPISIKIWKMLMLKFVYSETGNILQFLTVSIFYVTSK